MTLQAYYERSFMNFEVRNLEEGEPVADPFDYALAESLGLFSPEHMRDVLSIRQIAAWRGYHVYRTAQLKMATEKASNGR